MLFRLCNAPEIFQKLMNLILAEFINKFVIIYLDNILIYFKPIDSTWIILRKSLSVSYSLNCIAKSRNANFKSTRLSI